MLYPSAQAWRDAPHKRVLIFAMSGLGKTYVSELLAEQGSWFHYSVDYRIGTRHMGEHIIDNLKREAMGNAFLREMLMQDLIHFGVNVHDHDLRPVAAYLGKPGNPALGGLPIGEYQRRQDQFRTAEIAALKDTAHFIDRAQSIYGYEHFICDSGGSICEWVDPSDPDDPLLSALAQDCLMVWIKGSDAHTDALVKRFDKAPKPMSYQPEFLENTWSEYLIKNNAIGDDVNPDEFIRWTYAQALAHRQPRYEAMANNFGITVDASDWETIKTESDFVDVIANALAAKPA
ncbi:MAG: ATPase [Planktotalea sp.]|uniref:ATPase n=1 Tax=Planktotalea sp. TaxID=2029877 RepID=UPI003C738ADE